MKHSKKYLLIIAIAICFSICIDTVSHAKSIINYKEINYGKPVNGLKKAGDVEIHVDSSGKVIFNLSCYDLTKAAWKLPSNKAVDGRPSARVTYSSNGKKKINRMEDKQFRDNFKYVYGKRAYNINFSTKNMSKSILTLYTKKGKEVKKININSKKYCKTGSKYVLFQMAEIVGENKVRLYYADDYAIGKYGGMVEVNAKTGKIRELVSTDNYFPRAYDGKYVYGYSILSKQITFYRTSLKTKKTESFTASAITFDKKKYPISNAMYSFYKGGVMGIEPSGKVFYGTFDSKKFEQIGNISKCKNFKKYEPNNFVMKSKNEFYITYSSDIKKGIERDTHYVKNIFLVKYKKK